MHIIITYTQEFPCKLSNYCVLNVYFSFTCLCCLVHLCNNHSRALNYRNETFQLDLSETNERKPRQSVIYMHRVLSSTKTKSLSVESELYWSLLLPLLKGRLPIRRSRQSHAPYGTIPNKACHSKPTSYRR